jgi:hypothetical protein
VPTHNHAASCQHQALHPAQLPTINTTTGTHPLAAQLPKSWQPRPLRAPSPHTLPMPNHITPSSHQPLPKSTCLKSAPTFKASHTTRFPCASKVNPKGRPGPRCAIGSGSSCVLLSGFLGAARTAPYLSIIIRCPSGHTLTDSARQAEYCTWLMSTSTQASQVELNDDEPLLREINQLCVRNCKDKQFACCHCLHKASGASSCESTGCLSKAKHCSHPRFSAVMRVHAVTNLSHISVPGTASQAAVCA